MNTAATTKALPPALQQIFGRLREGASAFVPRELTAAEAEARRQAAKPLEVERQKQARLALEKYRQTFDGNVTALAEQVGKGEIGPAEFRARMLLEIRMMLFTAAAAAAGGVGNMKPGDVERVDRKVREQAVYLDRWAAQLERQPLERRSVGQLQQRARMYGGSGTQMLSETMDSNQFGEFPEMPFHPADRTQCRHHCACDWIWLNVDREKGNADVYWTMNVKRVVVEHCQTCLKRRKAFYPLRIRNWEFVNLPGDLSPYLYLEL